MDNSRGSGLSDFCNSTCSHIKTDLLQIQEMKLENEHLQQRITHLQSSLQSSAVQLKQALDAANSLGPLQEELAKTKASCRDSVDKLKLENIESKQEIELLNGKISKIKTKYKKHICKQQEEIENQAKYISSLEDEFEILKDENSSLKNELLAITDGYEKLLKSKKKSVEISKQIKYQYDSVESDYNKAAVCVEKLETENDTLKKQVDDLNYAIEILKKEKSASVNEIASKDTTIGELKTSLDLLEKQYNVIKEDLIAVSESRSQLVNLIHRIYAPFCHFEERIEVLQNQIKKLQNKSKKSSNPVFSDKFDFNQLAFPFEEPVLKKIQHILSLDHFQTIQKLQLIINDIAKTLSQTDKEKAQLESYVHSSEEYLKDMKSKYHKLYEFTFGLMRELKNLECNEHKIEKIAFCHGDTRFIQIIAENAFTFDKNTDPSPVLGQLFVTADIFDDSHLEARRTLIESIQKEELSVSTIVSALFLLNSHLRKQVAELMNGQVEKTKITEALHKLGVDNISQAYEYIEDVKVQFKRMKESRKEAHRALVNANNDIEEKSKECKALCLKIEELQTHIEGLTQENITLKNEIEVARGECQRYAEKAEPHTNDHSENMLSTITALQNTVREKSRENKELKECVNILKEEIENDREQNRKDVNKISRSYKREIENLTSALQYSENKASKNKKKATVTISELKKQYLREIELSQEQIETLKTNYEKEVSQFKSRSDKAENELKSKREEIIEAEKNNQTLMSENTKLKNELRVLEMKNQMLIEQNIKDQKSAQAANAAQMFGLESIRQKEQKDLRVKFDQEKQRIIEYFTTKLGLLYGINDLDYDEQTINQIFARVHNDLNKLKYFQDQATKCIL